MFAGEQRKKTLSERTVSVHNKQKPEHVNMQPLHVRSTYPAAIRKRCK